MYASAGLCFGALLIVVTADTAAAQQTMTQQLLQTIHQASSSSKPTATVLANAWLPVGDNDTYPENLILQSKPDIGICFSGGGSRSFSSTLGYLQGLVELNLMNNVKYISSTSGGAWAITAYIYHDPNVIGPLDAFFGHALQPEDQSLISALRMPKSSARGYPVRSNLLTLVPKLIPSFSTASEAWVAAIHQTFLQPAGINLTAIPAWSAAQVKETRARNPGQKFEFMLPCGGLKDCFHRPFPILNSAQLGPLECTHFELLAKKYVMMEMTPMYIGFPTRQVLNYSRCQPLALGGFLEPIGFGSNTNESFCGLLSCPGKQITVSRPRYPFALSNYTSAASWAHGGILKDIPSWDFMENATLSFGYLNSATGGVRRDLQFGDGGNLENQGLLALLRRKVRRIVMFVNSQTPLRPRIEYNPFWRPPRSGDMDSSFAALFGFKPILPKLGFDSSHIQVFSRSSLAHVVDKLQRAQLKGNGCVASVNLTTLANVWWGILPGQDVRLTIVYLGRAYNWEKLLPEKVAELVAPFRSTTRPADLPANGTFKSFPHIETARLHLTASVANKLTDLAWWVIVKNVETFRRELTPVSYATANWADAIASKS